MSKEVLILMGLVLMVTATALAVVYGKYRSRMLFNEEQHLAHTLDALDVEWQQLLIEEHALADPALIERLARQRLGMVVPKTEAIVYLSVQR